MLPPDPKEAKEVVRLSSKYVVGSNNELYKRCFSQPLLKCLGPLDTHYSLREVYEGIYGVHIKAMALTKQVIRVRFFCPTPKADAKQFMGRHKECHMYAKVSRQPTT